MLEDSCPPRYVRNVVHKIRPETGFLSLAEELRLYILSFLPCRDILRCTSVCKALRRTYMSSSELQYIVELRGQWLLPVHNTDNLTPVSKRLQLLRDKAHAWLKFDIHAFKTVSIPESPYYVDNFVADGHLYLWNSDDSGAIIPILPQPSQQTIERHWSPGTLRAVPHSTSLTVLMVPSQNLVAVVYIVDNETIYTDLRALDSGSVHPQAAGPTLFLSEELPECDNNGTERGARIKACGGRIALLCYHTSWLQIWDWKHSTTSSCFLDMLPYISSSDFCFLENNGLLILSEDLRFFSIEDMSRPPQLLACFLFPFQFSVWGFVDDIGHSSHLQMQDQRMMHTSGLDHRNRLLCFTTYHLVFVISTRVFFDLDGMAATATPIPWDRWGPSNTRVFEYLRRSRIHCSGNRLLQSFTVGSSSGQHMLRMMDFSPLAVTNNRGLGRVVTEPSTTEISGSFGKKSGESITTSLPYVEVVSDRGFDEIRHVWLDRDRIYILHTVWEYRMVYSIRSLEDAHDRLDVIEF